MYSYMSLQSKKGMNFIMKKNDYFYAYPEFDNVKELMLDSIEKNEDCRAFIIKDKEGKHINITYKDLKDEINYLGTSFFNLGLKDKRIAVVGKNSYMWALTYLTTLFGNMVLVPLDKDLEEGELENCLVRSKADAIIFDEKLIDKIRNIREKGKTSLKEYFTNSVAEDFKNFDKVKAQGKELFESGKKDFENVKVDSDKMSILVFTSGTTSKSKAVMLSQRNVAMDICIMKRVEGFTQEDVNLQLLPLHHMFGSSGILVFLASGSATAFPDGLRYIQANMKEYGVSIFVGVPALIEAFYKKLETGIEKQGKTKLVKAMRKITNPMGVKVKRRVFKSIIDELGGSLRVIISGAASLDNKIDKFFNEIGIRLVQGYGLTETSPVIAAENDRYKRAGSVGFPMNHVKVEIADKDEQGIGEIKVQGPIVMQGYYENEEATKEVLKDGWFYTGDYGYIDREGFLFITGRKKNMIVLQNGKKIFPEEVEELINRIDLVKESMVFGLPKGNDVLLSVKVKYDEDVANSKYSGKSEEELEKITWNSIKEVNSTFPGYKHIKNLIFTKEDFIKTTTAKIKRFEEIKKITEKLEGNN